MARLSRLAPLDKALVLILVPLWVVCFSLSIRTQVRGAGSLNLGLTLADAESYPVLTGEFARTHATNPIEEAGVEPALNEQRNFIGDDLP